MILPIDRLDLSAPGTGHVLQLSTRGRRFYVDCECGRTWIAWSRRRAGELIAAHRAEQDRFPLRPSPTPDEEVVAWLGY